MEAIQEKIKEKTKSNNLSKKEKSSKEVVNVRRSSKN